MTKFAVEINSLSKHFGKGEKGVQALSGLSLLVKEGEIFAFLGPNGSGKTTTLNILSCILDPDAGEILVRGKRRGDAGYFDGVSFMSGDSQYYWAFTVKDILEFYSALARVPWSKVMSLLTQIGLDSFLSRSWSGLSNGEQTKLRLVQALLSSPKLLFLDEPTVGLDPDVAEFVRNLLKDLNAQGTTIFLTSHYMRDVESLADTVAFIRNGKLLEILDRGAFGGADALEKRFIQHARGETP